MEWLLTGKGKWDMRNEINWIRDELSMNIEDNITLTLHVSNIIN